MRPLDTKQLPDLTMYEVWLKGKRQARLFFKREQDLFLCYAYGTDFRHACNLYFSFTSKEKDYNQRRNTYKGYTLFEKKR